MSGFLSSISKLALFKEEFAQAWTLLNDTERFLKRFSLFDEYESRLRKWRRDLNAGTNTKTGLHEIKAQIIAFRKELRLLGYDLRLGAMDIVIVGSRSDDAPRYGFRRASMILAKPKVSWLSGEENHVELTRHLSALSGPVNFTNLHNIWFRWNGPVLEIAAADSESAEQLEKLREFITNNKLYALSALKNLK